MRWSIPLLAAAACAPATVQLAQTNGKGNIQVALEPGVVGVAVDGGNVTVPAFNVAVRYGLSNRTDIGGRLGSSVYELQLKTMLTDPDATDRLAISVAPAVTVLGGGAGGTGALYLDAKVPVLFGVPIGRSQLTVGPMLRPTFLAGGGGGSSAGGLVLNAGAQLNFAARVGDKAWIAPQVDLVYPLLGAVGVKGGTTASTGDLLLGSGLAYGVQLGILLGGRGEGGAK
jgi:hypothetical protein